MKKQSSYRRVAVRLHWRHVKSLQKLTSKGSAPARSVRRANILLTLNRGVPVSGVALMFGCSEPTVRRVAGRYADLGLDQAIFDSPRPGQARSLTEEQAQKIVSMLCGPPPEGRGRWSVRLAVIECRKRKISLTATREPIRQLMKRHDLKPWLKKNVVCSRDRR